MQTNLINVAAFTVVRRHPKVDGGNPDKKDKKGINIKERLKTKFKKVIMLLKKKFD